MPPDQMVPPPWLIAVPENASYAPRPPSAIAKAVPEATAVRFQPRTRVPCTVASPNSSEGGTARSSRVPSAAFSSRGSGI
ncbi:hypothetical protein AB0C90_18905 [Streptomyces sp. NPDC048550]|uniref:hypothetical protein n=1 Tax=Streptomyces sp. NPDC048550 TaxID=3155739 RepID=UPI0034282E95